jgi:hypothetical protein
MKIDFNKLLTDPFEVGRFSMHYNGDECLGVTDHFVNNIYSEDEFKEQIGDSYDLDEWEDIADEMDINITDVPVYDVQGNLTDRKYSDYVEHEYKGIWVDYRTLDYYLKYKLIQSLSYTIKRVNEGGDIKECVHNLRFMLKRDF